MHYIMAATRSVIKVVSRIRIEIIIRLSKGQRPMAKLLSKVIIYTYIT